MRPVGNGGSDRGRNRVSCQEHGGGGSGQEGGVSPVVGSGQEGGVSSAVGSGQEGGVNSAASSYTGNGDPTVRYRGSDESPAEK